LHNPSFNSNEFVTFKSQAGLNSFNLTPRKWIAATQAIGFISKSGRYGGGTLPIVIKLLDTARRRFRPLEVAAKASAQRLADGIQKHIIDGLCKPLL
jgi:hypothetical protein